MNIKNSLMNYVDMNSTKLPHLNISSKQEASPRILFITQIHIQENSAYSQCQVNK